MDYKEIQGLGAALRAGDMIACRDRAAICNPRNKVTPRIASGGAAPEWQVRQFAHAR